MNNFKFSETTVDVDEAEEGEVEDSEEMTMKVVTNLTTGDFFTYNKTFEVRNSLELYINKSYYIEYLNITSLRQFSIS